MGGELFTDFSGTFTDSEYFNKQIDVLVKNLTKLEIHPSATVGEFVLDIISFLNPPFLVVSYLKTQIHVECF